MTYAYIRVPTRDQNEDRQLAALISSKSFFIFHAIEAAREQFLPCCLLFLLAF